MITLLLCITKQPISVVPEPSSIGLFVMALLVFGFAVIGKKLSNYDRKI